MTEDDKCNMLKEIIEYIDYDLYKELFVYNYEEDEEDALVTNLMHIIDKYVNAGVV